MSFPPSQYLKWFLRHSHTKDLFAKLPMSNVASTQRSQPVPKAVVDPTLLHCSVERLNAELQRAFELENAADQLFLRQPGKTTQFSDLVGSFDLLSRN